MKGQGNADFPSRRKCVLPSFQLFLIPLATLNLNDYVRHCFFIICLSWGELKDRDYVPFTSLSFFPSFETDCHVAQASLELNM